MSAPRPPAGRASLDPTQADSPAIRAPTGEAPAWQQASRAKRPAAPALRGSFWSQLRAWRPAPLPAGARGRGYLRAHWRGELDLARSFWLHHGLLFIPLALALSAWGAAWLWRGANLQAGALGQLLGWPLVLALGVWSAVGSWRAISAWRAQGGTPLAAGLAQTVVAGSMLQTGLTLALAVLPQLGATAQLALGRDPTGPARIERSADGLSLQLRGSIALGDAERLRQALEQAPPPQRLELLVSGGRLAEAQAMAALVRARALPTRAVGLCADACLPVFLAGPQRQLSPGAQLGLRPGEGPSYNPVVALWLRGQQRELWQSLGLPTEWVERGAAVLPWTPTIDELQSRGLISALPQTLELALPSGRDVALTVFQDALAQHPVWRALEARLPGVSATLAGELQAGRAAGASDAALQGLAWPLLAPQMPALIRGVDPILRRRYVQLVLSQLKALRTLPGESGSACRDLLEARLAVRLSLPLALQIEEAQWLVDAAGAPLDRRVDQPVKAIELEVVRRTVGGAAPGLLAGLWKPRAGATFDCGAAIGLIERAALQTPARRDLAERLLFMPG